MEGRDSLASVIVWRDLSVNSDAITLHYATSDLTAKGVDTIKFDDCLRKPISERYGLGCGDYELTHGYVTIEANRNSGGFIVRLMDNLCNTGFPRFIQVCLQFQSCLISHKWILQLTLALPGSGAILGENYFATLRIDDDDLSKDLC